MFQAMAEADTPFTDPRSKPRWGTLLLVGALHLLALALLVRAFAPDFTEQAIERVTALVTVTVTTPPPAPSPQPSEGAAAEEGRRATPRKAAAPRVPRPLTVPAPRASSPGPANVSGAGEQGAGAGAGGEGTGSGRGGGGTGDVAVTKPVKIAGAIDDARDYPTPPGGRQVRNGHSVTIVMTVGVDGRALDCRVISPSPDPAADRLTCELAVARFRFRPATDAAGHPVPATYGWRQSWFTG
jgi:protein TonB